MNSSGTWETLISNLRHAVTKEVPDKRARNVHTSYANVRPEGV
jgi:hypothetical protein